MRDFPGVATSGANAPTRSGQVNGHGFGELNLDAHSAFSGCWSASVGLYNLLHSRAAAAEFWYVDRLKNEIGTYPEGHADIHEHPLEPIMMRFTITKQFGHWDPPGSTTRKPQMFLREAQHRSTLALIWGRWI